jgi:(p)ppGpp synthase/HD superfamily hydrolase
MLEPRIVELLGHINPENPDPHELLKVILREMQGFNPPKSDLELMRRAFWISYKGHLTAPPRASGEAYIFHLVRSTIRNIWKQQMLGIYDLRLLLDTILHDCVEDAKSAGRSPLLARMTIATRLSIDIMLDVSAVSKGPNETRLEFNNSLLGTRRWRAIALKFEDRKDNLDTLESMERGAQIRKVQDTIDWFVGRPLWEGMTFIKRLHDLMVTEHEQGKLGPQYLHLPGLLLADLLQSLNREKERLGMP